MEDLILEETGFSAQVERPDTQGNGSLQHKIWELFEYPDSSIAARCVSLFSMLVIGVSITVFCLETLPYFKRQVHRKHTTWVNNGSIVVDMFPQKFSSGMRDNFQRSNAQPWFSLELICVTWFGIEYLIRILSSPSKRLFLTSFLNTVDLLAIAPYFFILWLNTDGTTTRLPGMSDFCLKTEFSLYIYVYFLKLFRNVQNPLIGS